MRGAVASKVRQTVGSRARRGGGACGNEKGERERQRSSETKGDRGTERERYIASSTRL